MNWINIFGITFNINPIAFTIPIFGGWPVYWYGIIITAGFLLAILYGFKQAKSFDIDTNRLTDVILVTAPLAILCARLYYIIFDNNMKFSEFFNIHDGGLAILGGVIGAAVFGIIMCKIRKINIASSLDIAALGFLIGQGIGRWGNFVNQEAYGSFTGSDWFGMTGNRITEEMQSGALVHPCFLYESVWCLLGFVLLHFLSKRRKFNGQIAVAYLIWYGFGRFFIEGLRTDSLYIGSSFLRVSQVLSLLMVIAGVAIMVWKLYKIKTATTAITYESVFNEEAAEFGVTVKVADLENEQAEADETQAEPEGLSQDGKETEPQTEEETKTEGDE